jgi:hypothetical protein
MTHALLHRFCTRRCTGCEDPGYHDAHLTLLGRYLHVWAVPVSADVDDEAEARVCIGCGNHSVIHDFCLHCGAGVPPMQQPQP